MEVGDPGTTSGPLARFRVRLKRLQAASGVSQASLAGISHLGRSQMSETLNAEIKRVPD
jgi:transcriptional regulator with XRE-family HTH domain